MDKDIKDYVEKNKRFLARENLVNFILRETSDVQEKPRKQNNLGKRLMHWIDIYQRHMDEFTGKYSNIASSEDEGELENRFNGAGLFHRRHTRYSELYNTERKFLVDFVFYLKNGKKLVMEYAPLFDDSYIHDKNYEKRLKDKRKIVEEAEDEFIEVHEFNLKDVSRLIERLREQVIIPKEAYTLPSPLKLDGDYKPKKQKEKRYIKRQVYFATQQNSKLAMLGYMREN